MEYFVCVHTDGVGASVEVVERSLSRQLLLVDEVAVRKADAVHTSFIVCRVFSSRVYNCS